MVRVEERRDEHTHTFILLNLVAVPSLRSVSNLRLIPGK